MFRLLSTESKQKVNIELNGCELVECLDEAVQSDSFCNNHTLVEVTGSCNSIVSKVKINDCPKSVVIKEEKPICKCPNKIPESNQRNLLKSCDYQANSEDSICSTRQKLNEGQSHVCLYLPCAMDSDSYDDVTPKTVKIKCTRDIDLTESYSPCSTPRGTRKNSPIPSPRSTTCSSQQPSNSSSKVDCSRENRKPCGGKKQVKPCVPKKCKNCPNDNLGPEPVELLCPCCNRDITTIIKCKLKLKYHFHALLLTPLLMCCIPYMMKDARQIIHYCCHCHTKLGYGIPVVVEKPRCDSKQTEPVFFTGA